MIQQKIQEESSRVEKFIKEKIIAIKENT